jgi:hypothetical protein
MKPKAHLLISDNLRPEQTTEKNIENLPACIVEEVTCNQHTDPKSFSSQLIKKTNLKPVQPQCHQIQPNNRSQQHLGKKN